MIQTRVCLRVWVRMSIFLCLVFAASSVTAQEALTLKECYQLALKRSETVAINQEILKETEGKFIQSINGVLPQVNYQIEHEWQDRGAAGSGGSRYRRFHFSQPLFSGFKEYAAISGSKALRREKENQLERAKQLLFTDVSDAFYYFQSYQEDLKAVDAIHQALEDRTKELTRRNGLGRSRDSEVASAEASLYKTEAEMEDVRSQMEVSRQLLEFLIGQTVDSIRDEFVQGDSVPAMNEFTSKADDRPDVKAAREALTVASKNVTVARAGFWPTISLGSDLYQLRTGSDSDWNITLDVNVPLFNGTSTLGLVQQAQSQQRQADWILIQAKRKAVLDIQNAYTQWTIGLKKELAYKKAAEASEKNYHLQEADYKNNLVSNLDVLQELQNMEEAQRNYIVAKNESKRFYYNLRVATGDLTHDAI